MDRRELLARVRESFHRHGLEGVVRGDVLEDLDGGEGGFVLRSARLVIVERCNDS